ncbi:hypothetical protein ACIQPQ_34370 [Streptomyces sp. NPDC091281]|uniref:hypothetical protein n=1 Tax=Streptomyces sp. NPDC091281 TaxID=3365985 RepID=UPI003826EA82
MTKDRRDIDEAYKQAMISEWRAYRDSGRTEQADHVAAVLLAEYDHDVHDVEADGKETAVSQQAPETTAAAKPPQTAVEPKPQTAGARGPAKKAAAVKSAAKDS